ncbi:MAG: ABC transporter ATP-binding protein [Promethearchaeota archaeon]
MKQVKETYSYVEEKDLTDTDLVKKSDKLLLEIRDVRTYFYTEEGVVKAVDGISFDMYEDETLGLVGETGCGKSVTALSILQLVRAPGKIIEGSAKFKGKNLLELSQKEMRNYRGKEITMIFQDPLNSLNPVMSVGRQISEVFFLHQKEELKQILDNKKLERKKKQEEIKELKNELSDKENRLTDEEKKELTKKINELKKESSHIPTIDDVALEKSAKIIKEVGIADAEGILKRYPHELSGGMRQRVMIAMALSCNPSLLIADEPTTALDVTIQAQILDLMKDLKIRFNTSILLITHDLGIIADMCDRVAVMYSGNIVEYATALDLFKNPRHPYTKGLISAIPSIEKRDSKLQTIRGMVPNLIYPPSGCRFHPRCDNRLEICDKIKPQLTEIGQRYFVACHLFDPKYKDSPKYDWDRKEDFEAYRM